MIKSQAAISENLLIDASKENFDWPENYEIFTKLLSIEKNKTQIKFAANLMIEIRQIPLWKY